MPVLYGVVDLEIRQRSARVQVLQNTLDRMCNLIEARAIEYADQLGAATGMLMKDYSGKNTRRRSKKGQTEKREAKGSVGMREIMARLNAGRQRVADAKAARDATALTRLSPDE